MTKNRDIESFLRENKPRVKDNPTFMLEVQQKMRAVDGIKTEVDRQRRYGRIALVAALVAGTVAGALAVAVAYLYPIDHQSVAEGIFSGIRIFLEPWKQYLIIPIAACAISLGLVSGIRKSDSFSL